jgi:hypothetical protein
MEKPFLKQRTYNVTAMSFTPEELFDEIRKHVPKLQVKICYFFYYIQFSRIKLEILILGNL